MTQMFLSPAKPFYQSTVNMGLDPIDRATYTDFAKRMFRLGNKSIDDEAVGQVYQEPFFREILAALPTKQKSLLYAIVRENGAQNITSAAFIQHHKLISASSIQSAMKGLYEKDIVTESEEAWYVYDIFLARYLRDK